MDKRKETRVEHTIRTFVHILKCAENPELVGVSIACEAVDISTHGLRLLIDLELKPKTMLNSTITIEDPFAMYLLRGHVRWVVKNTSRGLGSPSSDPNTLTRSDSLQTLKTSDDDYYMGVLLSEEEGTDLDAWVNQFNRTVQSLIRVAP